jgi:acetyl esterase/lipase
MRGLTVLRKVAPAVVGLALLASGTGCDWPPNTRFVNQVFTQVQVTSDIVYRTATDYQGNPVPLALDIYQPVGDTLQQRPVVMWMHGGCWTSGNKRLMSTFAEDSARRGYVGVSINYRLRNTCSIAAANDALQDAAAAVQWLKDHAAQYRLDPRAIVAGGHSAGAFNAANLLFQVNPSPVAGGVVLAGYAFAGPTAGDPPLIMHLGTADTTVRQRDAEPTCNNTRAAGNVCVLYLYQGQGHLFPYQEPYQTQLKERSAHDIFEQVLIPLGYQAVQMTPR